MAAGLGRFGALSSVGIDEWNASQGQEVGYQV